MATIVHTHNHLPFQLERRDAAWLLVWSVLLLLPLGRLSEIPLLLGALTALWLWLRKDPIFLARVPFRWCAVIAGAYVLPQWLSAIDSVAAEKSWQEALLDLRFFPFVCFIAFALRDAWAVERFLRACAAVILFWVLDGLVQAISGWSLGGPNQADRLSGVFGADNLKLGPVLGVLSPLLWWTARNRFGARGLALVWVMSAIVVMLAGSRAGWVGFGLASAGLLWILAPSRGAALKWSAAALIALALLGVGLYSSSTQFSARVDRTLQMFKGNEAALDEALAFRLPIWRAAIAMGQAHPINGVGVRAFRHAYPDHAAANDRWVDIERDQGAAHAHQLVLELWSETGLSGLAIWLVAAAALWRHARAAPAHARVPARGLSLALLAMVFPLNTHLAFYSGFWGLLLIWLLSVWFAVIHASSQRD